LQPKVAQTVQQHCLVTLSGYVGHVTTFILMFTIAHCLVVWLALGIGLQLDLVSGW